MASEIYGLSVTYGKHIMASVTKANENEPLNSRSWS